MSIKESRLKPTDIGLPIAKARGLLELLKPRVMALAIFTAFVGLVMAPAGIGPATALVAILAIAAGAGAAGALNMWYESDSDAKMSRTRHRPIPTGRILRGEALGFGLVLSALSVLALGLVVNWLAAFLLAFTIFFYAVVYTMWLKRSTPQNIVIGGAAGAMPPVIGWAAASGSVGAECLVLFLLIFLWTPPHFWSLALFKSADYAAVGIPMMPNVVGPASTKKQVFVYSLLLAPTAVLPAVFGIASEIYGIFAALLGAEFIRHSWLVLVQPDLSSMKAARRLFSFSILYLFAIFAALLADTTIGRALA